MKKFLIFFTLAMLITTSINKVYANIPEPKWEEFCPYKYLNIMPVKHPWYSNILYITRENNKNYDYWITRKRQFENEIKLCQQIQNPEQLIGCYINIRQIESAKNDNYEQNLIARQNLQIQRVNAYSALNTSFQMNSLNNNLQNINNNLNGINNNTYGINQGVNNMYNYARYGY